MLEIWTNMAASTARVKQWCFIIYHKITYTNTIYHFLEEKRHLEEEEVRKKERARVWKVHSYLIRVDISGLVGPSSRYQITNDDVDTIAPVTITWMRARKVGNVRRRPSIPRIHMDQAVFDLRYPSGPPQPCPYPYESLRVNCRRCRSLVSQNKNHKRRVV